VLNSGKHFGLRQARGPFHRVRPFFSMISAAAAAGARKLNFYCPRVYSKQKSVIESILSLGTLPRSILGEILSAKHGPF
jgi:hypothetical protein